MPHSTPRSPMIAAPANGLQGEGYFTEYEVLDPTPAMLARSADLTATAEAFERTAARHEAHGYAYLAGYNAERAAAYHDLARQAARPVVQRTCVPSLGCADKRAAKKRDRLRAAADIAEQIAPEGELDAGLLTGWPAFVEATCFGHGIADERTVAEFQRTGGIATGDEVDVRWAETLRLLDEEEALAADLPAPWEVAQAYAEHEAEQAATADDLDWVLGEGAYAPGAPVLGDGVDPDAFGWGFRIEGGEGRRRPLSERGWLAEARANGCGFDQFDADGTSPDDAPYRPDLVSAYGLIAA